MAFRRRFRGRRGSSGLARRPASAFAPAMSGGRSLGWESLANVSGTNAAVFNVVTAATILSRVLLPENLTRGVVTLERIRGCVFFVGADNDFTAFGDEFITAGIQLVPLVNGVVPVQSVLDPDNAGDLESNRWIWRCTYGPANQYASATITRAVCYTPPSSEIDVKSRRRFNRSAWALYMTVTGPGVTQFNTNLTIRALFRSGDGM